MVGNTDFYVPIRSSSTKYYYRGSNSRWNGEGDIRHHQLGSPPHHNILWEKRNGSFSLKKWGTLLNKWSQPITMWQESPSMIWKKFLILRRTIFPWWRPEKEKGATFFMQHCFLLSSWFGGGDCFQEYVQVISVLPTFGYYLLKKLPTLRTLSVKNEVSFLNKELVQNSK